MKYLIPVLALFFVSCNIFDNEQVVNDELTGVWEWQSSIGGFTGETINSDTVDYTQHLKFYKNGKAVWYRDDEVYEEFKVEKGKAERYEGRLVMIPAKIMDHRSQFKINRIIYKFDTHHLEIGDDCADCYNYQFSR